MGTLDILLGIYIVTTVVALYFLINLYSKCTIKRKYNSSYFILTALTLSAAISAVILVNYYYIMNL